MFLQNSTCSLLVEFYACKLPLPCNRRVLLLLPTTPEVTHSMWVLFNCGWSWESITTPIPKGSSNWIVTCLDALSTNPFRSQQFDSRAQLKDILRRNYLQFSIPLLFFSSYNSDAFAFIFRTLPDFLSFEHLVQSFVQVYLECLSVVCFKVFRMSVSFSDWSWVSLDIFRTLPHFIFRISGSECCPGVFRTSVVQGLFQSL